MFSSFAAWWPKKYYYENFLNYYVLYKKVRTEIEKKNKELYDLFIVISQL